VVSYFLEAPRLSHWDASIHIVRYLKRALGRGILFRENGHLKVEGFTTRMGVVESAWGTTS
jgi:hypothetical protein